MKNIIILSLVVSWASVAFAQKTPSPTDEFDPLIDAKPTGGQARFDAPSGAGSGFTVSGHAGFYAGFVNSYLTPDDSRLLRGLRPNFGVGIGYRGASPVEAAVDVALGLGKTFDVEHPKGTFAFDALFEPRVFAHWYESWPFSVYSGLGVLGALFDVEGDGISQAGLGPSVNMGAVLRSDRHSALFIECTASYFYDAFAYRVRLPDQNEPDASRDKDEGNWYPIFRFSVGYRLTAF